MVAGCSRTVAPARRRHRRRRHLAFRPTARARACSPRRPRSLRRRVPRLPPPHTAPLRPATRCALGAPCRRREGFASTFPPPVATRGASTAVCTPPDARHSPPTLHLLPTLTPLSRRERWLWRPDGLCCGLWPVWPRVSCPRPRLLVLELTRRCHAAPPPRADIPTPVAHEAEQSPVTATYHRAVIPLPPPCAGLVVVSGPRISDLPPYRRGLTVTSIVTSPPPRFPSPLFALLLWPLWRCGTALSDAAGRPHDTEEGGAAVGNPPWLGSPWRRPASPALVTAAMRAMATCRRAHRWRTRARTYQYRTW